MTHNPFDRNFMRLTERFQLNPSHWIPSFPAPKEGIQQPTWRWISAEEAGEENGHIETEPTGRAPFFSGYELVEAWIRGARKDRGKTGLGFWGNVFSFLHEVTMGIYDTTDWVIVDEIDLLGDSE